MTTTTTADLIDIITESITGGIERASRTVWLAMTLRPDERRGILAASRCARAVLRTDADPRFVAALDLVDRWCAGEDVSVEALRAAARAAEAAAEAWAREMEAMSSEAAAVETASWQGGRAVSWASHAAALAAARADATEVAEAVESAMSSAAAKAPWQAPRGHAAPHVDLVAIVDATYPLKEIAAALEEVRR
jgi:hypothetical protein